MGILTIPKVPISYLVYAYPGLHDLDLDLAVQKVGFVQPSSLSSPGGTKRTQCK